MPKTLFSSSLDTDIISAPVFLCLYSTALDLHSSINSSDTFSNPSFSATSSSAPRNSVKMTTIQSATAHNRSVKFHKVSRRITQLPGEDWTDEVATARMERGLNCPIRWREGRQAGEMRPRCRRRRELRRASGTKRCRLGMRARRWAEREKNLVEASAEEAEEGDEKERRSAALSIAALRKVKMLKWRSWKIKCVDKYRNINGILFCPEEFGIYFIISFIRGGGVLGFIMIEKRGKNKYQHFVVLSWGIRIRCNFFFLFFFF